MRFPLQVRIENTTLCNAECVMCPREKLTRPQGTMSLHTFKIILDECAKKGTREVHLEGFGEPFLDKDIFEKIRYAKERGIERTLIVTNGSTLSRTQASRLIDSGLDRLKVSFYGTNREEYEAVHLKLRYERVRENIIRLSKMKRERRSPKPKVSIKFIGSLFKYPKFLIQWLRYGKVEFYRFHNYGTGRNYVKVKMGKGRRCPMVNAPIMQILWNGDVVPCCYDFNGEMLLGNVLKEGVEGVWRGRAYEEFREVHRRGEFEKLPICLMCDQLK